LVLHARTRAVAVRAHDIALGDFRKEAFSFRQQCRRAAYPERPRGRIAMIEVHLMRIEPDTAIGTRTARERCEGGTGLSLAPLYALDLISAMFPGITPIRIRLIARRRHAPF